MSDLDQLFANNRRWSEGIRGRDPGFFDRLSRQQAPKYLWIGCSDSRVPANEIVGLQPGELFVHRNVANLVVHSDLNCLSVLQYAIDALRVEHVIVCGHYGCGGIEAAWKRTAFGLIDNWLRHVQDIADRHAAVFRRGLSDAQAAERLAELNVIEQVANVSRSTVVMDAWRRGQTLIIHGVIYSLRDGLLRNLGPTIDRDDALKTRYEQAIDAIAGSSRPR
jgi:carbonic anhydrase